MRKKFIITITIFVILLHLFSQEKTNPDYRKFKSYFIKNKNDPEESQKKIPINIASKVLGEVIINDNIVGINTFDYFVNKNSENFIIEVGYPQGGYTCTFFIISFFNEIIKKSEYIGYNALDYDGGSRCDLIMVNDTLLEVQQDEVEYNDEGEEIKVYNEEYSHYIFNDKGYYKLPLKKISLGRLYPQSSIRILEPTELKYMKKFELDIMRNEIFADHGYIFKTEKWKEYFGKQKWYNPRHKDVTDKLTIIEKINIERILKVAVLK